MLQPLRLLIFLSIVQLSMCHWVKLKVNSVRTRLLHILEKKEEEGFSIVCIRKYIIILVKKYQNNS